MILYTTKTIKFTEAPNRDCTDSDLLADSILLMSDIKKRDIHYHDLVDWLSDILDNNTELTAIDELETSSSVFDYDIEYQPEKSAFVVTIMY